MQTFLPYANFTQSANVLDRHRLGKQRVECKQIITALTVPGAGWRNHPATKMWDGYVPALCHYMDAIVQEWVGRGYKNTMEIPWMLAGGPDPAYVTPPWFGREDFHASHRSNLLRKDPEWYGKFGWTEPPDLEYVWPVD